MKPVLAIAVGLLVAGCAGRAERPEPTEVTRIPEQGGWFCQLGPSREAWQCVQDPDLAEHPAPTRIPEPAVRSEPEPAPLSVPDNPGPTGDRSPPANDSIQPPPPMPDAPGPAEGGPDPGGLQMQAAGTTREARSELPEYARLAYQPEVPTALSELPGHFYAVQVLAMSAPEDIEAFVQRHGMQRVSAARVERDGELYYVLLLGVYESRQIARQAIAHLPEPFADTTPWIRPVASLQSAMRRADTLASAL